MCFWDLIRRPFRRQALRLDKPLLDELQDLAEQGQWHRQELTTNLLWRAIDRHRVSAYKMELWDSLSPREQQIVALVCLHYTNVQIAASLSISPTTVATHVQRVLVKFNLHSKAGLQHCLSEFDFTSWDRQRP